MEGGSGSPEPPLYCKDRAPIAEDRPPLSDLEHVLPEPLTIANAPQQRRSIELTGRVLDAGLNILRQPDASFTIRAVATEAGVSTGAICGRFVDRDELLSAVHAYALDRLESRVRLKLGAMNQTLRQTLQAFVLAIAITCREDGAALFRIQIEGADKRAVARAVLALKNMRELLIEATTKFRHEIARPDPDFALETLIQIVLGTLSREVSFRNRGTSGRSWSRLCDELEDATYAYLTS